MRAGLNSILDVLDTLDTTSGARIDVFIRDDDAGWDHTALASLLDVTMRAGAPMDLAAIPQALDHATVDELIERIDTSAATGLALVGVHQHGLAHSNHETEGRRCEFGASRNAAEQHADLQSGWRILGDAFGTRVDPIFTPPWNRCTHDTAAQLASLGYAALSRDRRSVDAASPLPELPIDVDWSRAWRDDGEDRVAHVVAAALAARRADASPLGLMLHHAAMAHDERVCLEAWLRELANHPRLRWRLMRECLPANDRDAAVVVRQTPSTAPRSALDTASHAMQINFLNPLTFQATLFKQRETGS